MSKSKSSTGAPTVWGGQADFLTDLYGKGADLLGQQAPLNPEQLQAQAMQRQYAGSSGLQDIIGCTQQALQSNLNPQENPYLQRAMQSAIRPLTQNYQENVLSGITDQAVQSGQSGSSRHGIAEGIAGRGYMAQIGDITSQMAYGDYGAGMDRMGRAIDQAGGVANLGMMPSSIYGQIGSQTQMAPWQQLERYQGIMGDPTVLGGSSSSRGGTTSAIGTPFSATW